MYKLHRAEVRPEKKIGPIVAKHLKNQEVCRLWSYPHGQDRMVIVIYVNSYTSHETVHIPGEIAIMSFSIKRGIFRKCWTLVDPGKLWEKFFKQPYLIWNFLSFIFVSM